MSMSIPRRGPADRMVPLAELLAWGQKSLRQVGIAPIEAKWLLEWALDANSLIGAPEVVGVHLAEKYWSAVNQRKNHYPLQHITGQMAYRALTLKAGPGVFCCRPETELIVDLAKPYLPGKVADLCAGSGAIGIAIAVEHADCQVTEVEISSLAATYCRANAEKYGPELAPASSVTVVEDDATCALVGQENSFDLVVCNPPYVRGRPTQVEALHDPAEALYGGGEDGLVIPRGIVTRAAQLLKTGGTLIVELDPEQCDLMSRFAIQQGFATTRVEADLTGRDRFVVAQMGPKPDLPSPQLAAPTSVSCKDDKVNASDAGLNVVEGQNLEAVTASLRADLQADQLVVVPTETVYGIGANPFSRLAVVRLLGAKGRDEQMPPPVLAADRAGALALADLAALPGNLRQAATRMAEVFWPGPLTMILPARPGLGWNAASKGETVAVRVPAESTCLAILRAVGPLAVTSANLTGEPPATDIEAAQEYFGDSVSWYFDAGPVQIGQASTIVDMTCWPPKILREGPLSKKTIEQILDLAELADSPAEAAK